MEAIIAFLFKLYLTTVGISSAVKIYKELRAKQIIEEKGYEILKSDKEIQEQIADLYKQYSYILHKKVYSVNTKYDLLFYFNITSIPYFCGINPHFS